MGWTELDVDTGRKLPAICLKCGGRKRIVRRTESLTAATAAQGLGVAGGVCGAAAARNMREDPFLAMVVLCSAFAGCVFVGWLIHRRAPKVSLALPLCRDCNERWRVGLNVRYALIASLAVASGLVVWASLTHETAGYVFGAAIFALSLITAFAMGLRDRFVYAATIRESRALLKGVSFEAQRAIRDRMK